RAGLGPNEARIAELKLRKVPDYSSVSELMKLIEHHLEQARTISDSGLATYVRLYIQRALEIFNTARVGVNRMNELDISELNTLVERSLTTQKNLQSFLNTVKDRELNGMTLISVLDDFRGVMTEIANLSERKYLRPHTASRIS